jgi:uncharacterized membrane protein
MKFLAIFVIVVTLISCINKKQDPAVATCDLISNNLIVSFQKDISPILSINCYQCHSSKNASGGVILDNMTYLKAFAENGDLYESIRLRADGTASMPRGSKLTDCEINTIKLWVMQGSKNN